jgi:hypothetical protein
MSEFFAPIPVPVVIAAMVVATLVTLAACAPHRWVELAERAWRKRRARL